MTDGDKVLYHNLGKKTVVKVGAILYNIKVVKLTFIKISGGKPEWKIEVKS